MLRGAPRSSPWSSRWQTVAHCPRGTNVARSITKRRVSSTVELDRSRSERRGTERSIGNLFVRRTAAIDSNHPSFLSRIEDESCSTGRRGCRVESRKSRNKGIDVSIDSSSTRVALRLFSEQRSNKVKKKEEKKRKRTERKRRKTNQSI